MSSGWGIAGCGWVARDHALPGLLEAGERVVALHDLDAAAMDRWDLDVPRCGALAPFLQVPGLTAVYVAAPNSAHRPLVEAAARAGLPVLCEKPLAADVADAAALVRACDDAGVLLGTAYDQRWHPAHRALRDVVRSGELGDVTTVRVVYACWLPGDWTPDGLPHDNWRVDPDRAGGGAAIDLAPHGLDLVGVLLGEDVVGLSARLQRRVHDYARRDGGVDDAALLSGVTSGGVLVDLHVSYSTPDALPRRRLEVLGTRGLAVATDTMGQTAGGALVVHAADGTSREVPFDRGTSPFAAQFSAFSAAVRGEASWPYDADRDLRLHALLLDALDTAREAA